MDRKRPHGDDLCSPIGGCSAEDLHEWRYRKGERTMLTWGEYRIAGPTQPGKKAGHGNLGVRGVLGLQLAWISCCQRQGKKLAGRNRSPSCSGSGRIRLLASPASRRQPNPTRLSKRPWRGWCRFTLIPASDLSLSDSRTCAVQEADSGVLTPIAAANRVLQPRVSGQGLPWDLC